MSTVRDWHEKNEAKTDGEKPHKAKVELRGPYFTGKPTYSIKFEYNAKINFEKPDLAGYEALTK